MMDQFIPLVLSALGGTMIGAMLARLFGGGGTGGVLGGLLGGVAAHYGAAQLALGDALLGSTPWMVHLQNFLEGGIGGGLLGLAFGLVVKPKA